MEEQTLCSRTGHSVVPTSLTLSALIATIYGVLRVWTAGANDTFQNKVWTSKSKGGITVEASCEST